MSERRLTRRGLLQASAGAAGARPELRGRFDVVQGKKKDSDDILATFLASTWFTDWTMRRYAEFTLQTITAENKPAHIFEYEGVKYDLGLRWQPEICPDVR